MAIANGKATTADYLGAWERPTRPIDVQTGFDVALRANSADAHLAGRYAIVVGRHTGASIRLDTWTGRAWMLRGDTWQPLREPGEAETPEDGMTGADRSTTTDA